VYRHSILPPVSAAAPTAKTPSSSVAPVPVKADTGTPFVTALGRFEPMGEVIEIGTAERDRVTHLLVREGDRVKKGQELVHLEHYSERNAELDQISTELKEANAEFVAATDLNLHLIMEGETRLHRLEEILPLQVAAKEAEVRKLEAELANAKLELDRLEKLKPQKAVSQQEVDRQKLAVVQTEEQIATARAQLAEVRRALILDVELARTELETAQSQLVRDQSAIKVESLKKKSGVVLAQLERTIIRAPRDGEVLKIVAWEGEVVDGSPILKFGHTQQMYVVAEVYESDIQHVRLGQSAAISSPALPQSLTGKVDRIGRLVFKNDVLDVDPASDTDARVVEVKIRLDQSEAVSGLSNMQVDVKIRAAS